MRSELVERARGGDAEAFGLLAAGEIGRLLIIARLIRHDPDLAEDAVQEALVRCWCQLPRLQRCRWRDRVALASRVGLG